MKVYCEDCKHLVDVNHITYYCHAPENCVSRDTWLGIEYKYPLRPRKINKKNNCTWYKEKKVLMPYSPPRIL
jgi:hypothetical protein